MKSMAHWLRVGIAMFVVAYGANHFVPMLLVYNDQYHFSESQTTFLLAVYIAGLIPALLIGGPLSDKVGRRALIRPALISSLVGSVVLAVWQSMIGLSLGRFIIGISVGLVMASGAAWLAQLSEPGSAGAKRATIATSAGFGGGPIVAGIIAEYLPGTTVTPYIFHVILVILASLISWTTPEDHVPPTEKRRMFPHISRRFVLAVAAWAPWVFGSSTVAMSTVVDLVHHNIVYQGLMAGLTMLTGVAVQSLAQKLGEGYTPPAIVGLSCSTMGLGWSAIVALNPHWWLVPFSCIFLGAGYGIMMVSGLREVESIARPGELGALVSVYYALTYTGFLTPFVLSFAGPAIGIVECFIIGMMITAASIWPVTQVAQEAAREDRLAREQG